MGRSRKCLFGTLIYTFTLFLLLFLVIFLIIPVIFKYSVTLQRSIIFPTWSTDYANFSDVESFGLQGIRNFYVTVDENENVTLGVWQILPSKVLNRTLGNQHYDYEGILSNKSYNLLLYLHGNGAVRSVPIELYRILRHYFQIIAVDYRGYGDSTDAELTEDNVVRDIIQLVHWIQNRTEARIFVWGHSLGTGVSTHVVADLKLENFVPSGLVLETPFSTIPDVMERHFFVKLISWLPWYRNTMLDPVKHNNMEFDSMKHILDVDCPIMILHAKDDSIVPYDLATKLYENAIENRNLSTQGNVTYHLFEARGYDHMFLYLAPELPKYIREFVNECIAFENKTLVKTN